MFCGRPTAEAIAYIAHGARGQKRADEVTPYFTHPKRVAELAEQFHDLVPVSTELEYNEVLMPHRLHDAAYLHDVIEDTKLTADDLDNLGVLPGTIKVVVRLTKKNPDKPATAEYYAGIAESLHALVVKCADRCANLEDSLEEIKQGRGIERWGRYVQKTYRDLVPMYAKLPPLKLELIKRLLAIEEASA